MLLLLLVALSVSSGTEHKSTYVTRCLLSGAKRYNNRTFCLGLHYRHGAVSRSVSSFIIGTGLYVLRSVSSFIIGTGLSHVLSRLSLLARGCLSFCLELHYWHGAVRLTFCLELHYRHGAVSHSVSSFIIGMGLYVSRSVSSFIIGTGLSHVCLELHYWHGAKLSFSLSLGRHRQSTFSLLIGLCAASCLNCSCSRILNDRTLKSISN